MKYDYKMAECLFDGYCKLNRLFLNKKHIQNWKKHVGIIPSWYICISENIKINSKSKNINNQKSTTLNMVLLPQCAEQEISHLKMTPATSPNNNGPVQSSPSDHLSAEDKDSKSDIGEVEYCDCDKLEGCCEDMLFNPQNMKMDGISLIFTYGAALGKCMQPSCL